MIFKTVLKSLASGKARFICAVAGVAASVGAVTFVSSLSSTNSAQAPYLAEEAVRPWRAWKIDGDLGFGRRRGGMPAAAGNAARTGRKMSESLPRCDLKLELVGATIDCRPGGRALQPHRRRVPEPLRSVSGRT